MYNWIRHNFLQTHASLQFQTPVHVWKAAPQLLKILRPRGKADPAGAKLPGQPPPLKALSPSWSNNTIVVYQKGHQAFASDWNKPGYNISGASEYFLWRHPQFAWSVLVFLSVSPPLTPRIPVSLSCRESLWHLEKQDSCTSAGIVMITELVMGGRAIRHFSWVKIATQLCLRPSFKIMFKQKGRSFPITIKMYLKCHINKSTAERWQMRLKYITIWL